MSFAASTKKELTQVPLGACCQRAELAALVQLIGTRHADETGVRLDMQTENAAIARRVYTLAKLQTPAPLEVVVTRKMRLRKNNQYTVRVRRGLSELLCRIGLPQCVPGDGHVQPHDCSPPQSLLGKSCCRRSWLRGAFVAAGSVNDPDSHSYHLEILAHSTALALGIERLLASHGIESKMIERKKGVIVYLKEGDRIVEFLGLIGAGQALLHFEDVRIVKGMRNQVNRLINCETANLNKTITAAVRQLDNIRLIDERVGLEQLPQKLRMVAQLRLQYPDITLQELCDALPEQVSKSGLNHRLRKLDEIAERLRGATASRVID